MVGLVYRGHFLRRLRKQESGNGQKLPMQKKDNRKVAKRVSTCRNGSMIR